MRAHISVISAALPLLAILVHPARAQPTGLVVVGIMTPRPAVQGRYATAVCTIKDAGPDPVRVKGVDIALVGAAGETAFAVTPPGQSLPKELAAGSTYTFRQFQKMDAAGDFPCVARMEDAAGTWHDLTFAGGRRGVATLHVVPLDTVPRVAYAVTDPRPSHVYAPGEAINIQVLPVLTGGPDLSGAVRSVAVTPEEKPFSISDSGSASALLHGGDFQADFFGTPDPGKALDIAVTFAHPVSLGAWSIDGQDLNSYYVLKGCTAEAVGPDGKRVPLLCATVRSGDRWSVYAATGRSTRASGLRLRLVTPYKIDVQHLSLHGPAATNGDGVVVRAQWRDAYGHPLSPARSLALFQQSSLSPPAPAKRGYYGLVLSATVPGVDPARRQYGFAVLPPPSGLHDPRLGMVHMDIAEPNLGVGWVKTLATNYFDESTFHLDVAGWQAAIAARRAHGLSELPLLADGTWASDSTVPVGAGQLQRIHDEMLQHFQATPGVDHWELGLEENLGYRNHRTDWTFYWPNLEAKARAVRQAAADAHVQATLIYQIAERDPQTVTEFCRSGAQNQFDVLALHPYIWPDFPAPEQWMPPYLAQARLAMAQYHAVKPIWFTEIGAPLDGNPGGFFGYPDPGYFVRGLTRSEHATYLVKCNILALALGVGKAFWYTYRDGGDNPEYAEDHFGMIDVEGYPLPSYVAYSTMAREIAGKAFVSAQALTDDVRAYRFHGGHGDTVIVWTYPASSHAVPLSSLGLRPSQVAGAVDLFGAPVPVRGGRLPVTGAPDYLNLKE